MDHVVTEAARTKFAALDSLFNARLRWRWVVVEVRLMGLGDIACVAAATCMSRTTIRAGLKERPSRRVSLPSPAYSDV